jgi:hypothetical protein
MILNNDYDVQGTPNRAVYKRNENGSYTVDVKDYIVVTPDGQKYEASLRFPNAKLSVDDEEGIIYFDIDGIQYFSATDEQDNTIWELVLPDVLSL